MPTINKTIILKILKTFRRFSHSDAPSIIDKDQFDNVHYSVSKKTWQVALYFPSRIESIRTELMTEQQKVTQ